MGVQTSPSHPSEPLIFSPSPVSRATIVLNDPHPPKENAFEAFEVVERTIKLEIINSRARWLHEPRMWSRANGIPDDDLIAFSMRESLVEVRSAKTTYSTIVLGRIRLPAVHDKEGGGYLHVRIHDPPSGGTADVRFHSLWTHEGNRDEGGQPTTWRAIHTEDTPLELFNE